MYDSVGSDVLNTTERMINKGTNGSDDRAEAPAR